MTDKKTTTGDTQTAAHGATGAHSARAAGDSILTMPLDELKGRVAQAMTLWEQIAKLLPGGIVLTDVERAHTAGRLRDGESAEMLTILKVCETFPELFTGLSDLDEGIDPKRFETELLRDRLLRAEILAPFADAIANPKEQSIGDTVLHLRDLVRAPISEAYGIAKTMARNNTKLNTMVAPVINFYRKIAEAAAAARKENQAAKAAGK